MSIYYFGYMAAAGKSEKEDKSGIVDNSEIYRWVR